MNLREQILRVFYYHRKFKLKPCTIKRQLKITTDYRKHHAKIQMLIRDGYVEKHSKGKYQITQQGISKAEEMIEYFKEDRDIYRSIL